MIAVLSFCSSYLHCEWRIREEIDDKRFDGKLKRYQQKHRSRGRMSYHDDDDRTEDIFNPDFVVVDRVLDVMVGSPDHEDDDSAGDDNASVSNATVRIHILK